MSKMYRLGISFRFPPFLGNFEDLVVVFIKKQLPSFIVLPRLRLFRVRALKRVISLVCSIFIWGKLKGLSLSDGFSENEIFGGLYLRTYRLFVFLMATIVLDRRPLLQIVIRLRLKRAHSAYSFVSFGLQQRLQQHDLLLIVFNVQKLNKNLFFQLK